MSTTGRRPRADGVRNRAALLTAADAVFADEGTGASLSAVAARAGVAIGTLYKHFPTRRALVGALLADRHDALFDGEDGTHADLGRWVRTVTAHAATFRGLAEFLAADLGGGAGSTDGPDDARDRLAADCARMTARTDRLVSAARADGLIHPDVTTEDVVTLMSASAWVCEQEGAARAERLVTAGLAGMGLDYLADLAPRGRARRDRGDGVRHHADPYHES